MGADCLRPILHEGIQVGCGRLRYFSVLAAMGVMLGVGAACEQDDTGSLRAIIGDSLTPTGPADPCVKATDEDRLLSDMLERVNRERRRRNLTPVRRNDTLDRIAEFYACRLIDGGFFAHEDPDDHSRIDSRAGDFGYAFRKIGENLGAGQYSVEQVMREWMQSSGHRANILDPDYTEIGLAVRLGGEHGVYWVQEFGRPLVGRTGASADDDASRDTKDAGAKATPMERMKEVTPTSKSTPAADDASKSHSPDMEAAIMRDALDAVGVSSASLVGPLFADDWDVVLAIIDSE
ncbi:MAG TPA: CAP domain-containing protein [Phycisphaerae bacterium]|nr:CAP domain-containing protein [Phycisphaerae bacterium]HRW55753.1 CAP domain-containing protein [Phycisphaerae bacterium]